MMHGNGGRLARVLVAAGLLLAPATARGFCRTTTCDTADVTRGCQSDNRGCVIEGEPLFWPGRCVSFAVHRDGSPRRDISFDRASTVIENAFRAWVSSDCGGGTSPSLEIWDFGPIACNEIQFNRLEPNANAWIFRDDGWPHHEENATLALTTLTFEVNTGEILDADVEINSFAINLTTTDTEVDNDLLSIATHEAGHFLGLAHTRVASATMNADYSPGDLSFRSLEADDQAAICEAYPPDRDAPEHCTPGPLHGFSRNCGTSVEQLEASGCTVGRAPRPARIPAAIASITLLLGLSSALRRRRRPAGRGSATG